MQGAIGCKGVVDNGLDVLEGVSLDGAAGLFEGEEGTVMCL